MDPGAACLTTAVAVMCTVAVIFTVAHPLYAIFTNMFGASVSDILKFLMRQCDRTRCSSPADEMSIILTVYARPLHRLENYLVLLPMVLVNFTVHVPPSSSTLSTSYTSATICDKN